jgi:hypothetical protein
MVDDGKEVHGHRRIVMQYAGLDGACQNNHNIDIFTWLGNRDFNASSLHLRCPFIRVTPMLILSFHLILYSRPRIPSLGN